MAVWLRQEGAVSEAENWDGILYRTWKAY